jgi:hypothetical protein
MRLVIYRPDGQIDQMLELGAPTAESFVENADIFQYMLDRGDDWTWRVFPIDAAFCSGMNPGGLLNAQDA